MGIASGSNTRTSAPARCSAAATSRAGESRTSSVFGLNAAPSTAIRAPDQVLVEELASEVDDPAAAAQVDLVDLAQEGDRRAGADLPGAGDERPDVLGQAAAAEAEAGLEEPATDAGVVGERVGQLRRRRRRPPRTPRPSR